MDKEQKLSNFNPNGVGNTSGNIFGLPFEPEESKLVFIPVPWDVTASNHEGTSRSPELILSQSPQIDLFDQFAEDAWRKGMAIEKIDESVVRNNDRYRAMAAGYMRFLEGGGNPEDNKEMADTAAQINQACEHLIDSVENKCLALIENHQLPFVIGGDHSVSLGIIRAVSSRHQAIGILQIDAHADLRESYQGLVHSHASIMNNVIRNTDAELLLQVGIRELCNEERQMISNDSSKIITWYDWDIHSSLFRGKSWLTLCEQIVAQLPDKVYISFDIDGLEPAYCPNTGTPVPGGLSYNQVMFLFETLVNNGKTIVGADLVETGPSTYDAMIACRILYRMAGMMIKSNTR